MSSKFDQGWKSCMETNCFGGNCPEFSQRWIKFMACFALCCEYIWQYYGHIGDLTRRHFVPLLKKTFIELSQYTVNGCDLIENKNSQVCSTDRFKTATVVCYFAHPCYTHFLFIVVTVHIVFRKRLTDPWILLHRHVFGKENLWKRRFLYFSFKQWIFSFNFLFFISFFFYISWWAVHHARLRVHIHLNRFAQWMWAFCSNTWDTTLSAIFPHYCIRNISDIEPLVFFSVSFILLKRK